MQHFTFGLGSFLEPMEHDFVRVWKSKPYNYGKLAQLDEHQTSKPVSVRYEFNSHWWQLYIFDETF